MAGAIVVETPPSTVAGIRREPNGRHQRVKHARHAGANVIKKRYADNWQAMVRLGARAEWGSPLGILYLEGALSEREASAGKLYAEIAGKYDRLHGFSRRGVKSQAYEQSFGRDFDEVEHARQSGTIVAYESRARKAKKRWLKVQAKIPNDHARTIVEQVCLYEQPIASADVDDLARILGHIAGAFGLRDGEAEPREKKVRQLGAKQKGDIVEAAVSALR